MINRDDWLRALREVEPQAHDDAVTVTEFAALIGLGYSAAYRRLLALIAAGRAERSSKRIIGADKRSMLVGAYRLTSMKEDHIDIELEPGLDGADTRDSDDPGASSNDDCVRAKRRRNGPSARSTHRKNPRPVQRGRKNEV